jgi:hypothetical protein
MVNLFADLEHVDILLLPFEDIFVTHDHLGVRIFFLLEDHSH